MGNFQTFITYVSWAFPGNAIKPHSLLVNIGSGNGRVPSGSKPLPEPMLTMNYVAIWHHWATMRHDSIRHYIYLYYRLDIIMKNKSMWNMSQTYFRYWITLIFCAAKGIADIHWCSIWARPWPASMLTLLWHNMHIGLQALNKPGLRKVGCWETCWGPFY